MIALAKINVKVCAITVAYNNPDELTRLLSSLENQNYFVSGLVIIDNSDDYYSAANERIFNLYSKRHILARYHKTESNIGSAGGFRCGMKIAHENDFDWVWLLDQDGAVSPTCLTELLRHADESDILCPNILSIERPRISIPKVYANNIFGAWYPATRCAASCKIHTFGTHATLISKKSLEVIGYYDDSFFFVGWEDYEYGYRATKVGLAIVFVKKAEAFHPRSRSCNTSKYLNFLPAQLDYIREPAGEKPCIRSRSLSPFSQAYLESAHLKPWQFGVALVYSLFLALYHNISGERDIALLKTLRVHVRCLRRSVKKDWQFRSIEQLCGDIFSL
jgi:GT2 family glycosyltransferase